MYVLECIADPFAGRAGFVYLIFRNNNVLFMQCEDSDGIITAFEKTEVEDGLSALPAPSPLVADVGQEAYLGFRVLSGEILILKYGGMREYLSSHFNEYADKPFLSYEIGCFLQDDEKIMACLSRITERKDIYAAPEVAKELLNDRKSTAKVGSEPYEYVEETKSIAENQTKLITGRPSSTAGRMFGTGGIRGRANSEPMTAETALKVGMAAGCQFRRGRYQHRVLIGKDTRLSCYMLEAALTAGFISVGMDVILVGPMPTPAVAILTRSMRCDLGVMLSASQNPFEDNGIKLFGPDGFKLSDEVEDAIEGHVNNGLEERYLAAPAKLGRAKRLDDVHGRYIEFVKQTFLKGCTLSGLRIVLDCANGAAYAVAPEILWELGAEVIPIGVDPDGININRDCGSTSPEAMCRAVQEYRADFGIALDGDADRALIADEKGMLIDGDQVMAVIANHWRTSGQLKRGGVVATVMSNMGLERYLSGLGLTLERTKVGDRYVVEHMRRHGFNVGGEQSGHIILSDYTTTGDGLIAALQVLAVVLGSGRRPSEVCRVFEPLPQLLRNVRFRGEQPLEQQAVKEAIDEGQRRLGNSGRLLIRKSGTEPVIRVMAEGEDEALIGAIVDDICGVIRAAAA